MPASLFFSRQAKRRPMSVLSAAKRMTYRIEQIGAVINTQRAYNCYISIDGGTYRRSVIGEDARKGNAKWI